MVLSYRRQLDLTMQIKFAHFRSPDALPRAAYLRRWQKYGGNMNKKIKLVVGIPVIMIAIAIILEYPKLWWLLFAIPLGLMRRKWRSMLNSSNDSIYDPEFERMLSSPPPEKEAIALIHNQESKEK